MSVYSGGVQVEAWHGEDLKIGFCRKDNLPDSGEYNLWTEGKITSWSSGGGERSLDSVSCMGGYNKQYQKGQSDFEVSFDIIATDTFYEEMLMGDDGFYADLFDHYADNTAIQSAWTHSGDGAAPTLDTTNFKSGKQGMLMTWTDSTHTVGYTLDLSTTIGQTFNTGGYAGTAAANADRGRAEMIVYIATATDLANTTTISLQIGSSSTVYSQYDYTTSGNCVVGWNKIIYDLTTADSSAGNTDWSVLDHIEIVLTTSGNSSTGITVDRIRIFDPIIASNSVPGLWRCTLLYEINSSAAIGEKRRAFLKNCKVTGFEHSSDADGFLKGKLTLKYPPLDASGNPNYQSEHTPDASEAALTTADSY